MIILRDPVSRVVSDLLEVGVESLEEAYRRYAQPVWQPPHQTKHLDKHDKFLVDNFYIRTLLGAPLLHTHLHSLHKLLPLCLAPAYACRAQRWDSAQPSVSQFPPRCQLLACELVAV